MSLIGDGYLEDRSAKLGVFITRYTGTNETTVELR